MPADHDAAARAYARIRYRLLLADLVAGFVFLIAFQWSGASPSLAGWMASRSPHAPLVILGYLLVFGAAYELVMLPLHFSRSFLLEHRFGLSRMTLRAWAVRESKRLALGAALGAAVVEGLYALLRHAPSSWPLWAALGWVGLSIVLTRIFPTAVLPLFYRTAPLPDDALAHRLLALCRRVGLPALGVFRFDLGAETRKANAALVGLGKTRRVLLTDTLIAGFSPEEVEGVLAHELAHHRYHHIRTLLGIGAVGAWLAFLVTDAVGHRWVALLGLRGLADIAGFPVLMAWLSLLGLLSLPLQNGLSRRFERQADRFAIEVTPKPQAFADALRRLAALNLADPNPPRWVELVFYDHPRISERIRRAEAAR